MNTQAQVANQSNAEAPVAPAVGMGVTGTIHTDRQALTITRVSKGGKIFWATLDTVALVPGWKAEFAPGGFAGHCTNNYSQEYTYTSNPEGQEIRFTLGKNGKWKCSKRYRRVVLGVRRAFHDYNF